MTTATPDRAAFAAAYADGTAQLVWTELIADLETPVAAYLKLAGGEDFSFFRVGGRRRYSRALFDDWPRA